MPESDMEQFGRPWPYSKSRLPNFISSLNEIGFIARPVIPPGLTSLPGAFVLEFDTRLGKHEARIRISHLFVSIAILGDMDHE